MVVENVDEVKVFRGVYVSVGCFYASKDVSPYPYPCQKGFEIVMLLLKNFVKCCTTKTESDTS